MRVGYVRVSTVEQSEERQIIELRDKAGVEKFFVDKVSAKSAKRPKFDEMINFLREDDELIVSEFSRLFVPLPITAKLTYHYQRYSANGLSCRQAVRGHCPISCSMRNASPLSFFCSSHSKSR
ncbi:MAG: recombinase family protein [Selenomonadaceae bacterium]|nr:recombinase family protein [Selenomonadaceae bacterium]